MLRAHTFLSIAAALVAITAQSAPPVRVDNPTKQHWSFRPCGRPVVPLPSAADLNRDGRADLIVADRTAGTVMVMLGDGDGTFQAPQNYTVGFGPQGLTVGDLNADGIMDVVTANNDGTASVLLGNGDGTLKPAVGYTTGMQPFSVAIGDFNRDGFPDLAVANVLSNTVSVLLDNGDGTFQAATNFAVGKQPSSVAIGDFNGDGFLDITVANNVPLSKGTATILLNAADW
jgi:hypothetical protein